MGGTLTATRTRTHTGTHPLERAFESLGEIREHLCAIDRLLPGLQQALGALDDDEGVLGDAAAAARCGISGAWDAVTSAGNQLARRIQLKRETTGGAGSTWDGSADASQGG